jgi:hypothetical protein
MERYGGVARRRDLLQHLPRHRIDTALRSKRLSNPLPGVLIDGWLVDDDATWLRAVGRYVEGRGALSHTTALSVRGVLPRPAVDHVTTRRGLRLTGNERLVVHEAVAGSPGRVVRRSGLPVIDLESAVLTAWSLLPVAERRAPAIVAVRERMTTAARLLERLDGMPRLAGRSEQRSLLDALAGGAHSEFEIWGVEHFFPPDLLARSRGQLRVRANGRVCYLDRGFEEEMVGVELDGTTYHDRPEQRERDRRRDAALAALGWLIVRLSYYRALHEPEAALAELRQVLAMRRRQFGLPPAA